MTITHLLVRHTPAQRASTGRRYSETLACGLLDRADGLATTAHKYIDCPKCREIAAKES